MKLIIESTNYDWSGTWVEDEVKEEMKEMGYSEQECNDWIWYIIERAVEAENISEIIEFFIKENVHKLTVTLVDVYDNTEHKTVFEKA